MKIIISLITIIMLIFSTKSFSHDKENKGNEIVQSSKSISSGTKSDKIIYISTDGMVCDFCATSIEKVFMKKKEVQGIKIDLNNQKVIIFLVQQEIMENTIIIKLFEDAGYGVDKIERNI